MEVRSTMDDFLRLRHKLVPYLYTMNYRAWKEDTPIVVPMYYDYPETVFWGKNQAPNQYFFGSELMVIKERQYAVELTIGIKMSVPVFVLYPFVFTVVETGKIIDDAAV